MIPIEMTHMAMGALALDIMNMSKRFGDVIALDDVSLTIPAGGFHALLGENGAGKSTLVKCLVGFYTADQGTVLVDNREVQIVSPKDASQLGIGMVYQHFTLVPSMTVAENLVVARGALPAFINWQEERARLAEFMNTLPFQIALDKPAGALAAGEKQKVEIIKQLYLQRRLLILDEPTSVLTPDEADEVLGLVGDLAHQKQLTVLIITHKFREVTAYADAVTVLRRGRYAGSGLLPRLSIAHMAEMMVGSPLAQDVAKRQSRPAPKDVPPRLIVEKLCALSDNGLSALVNVDLSVRPGEILGIAGVSGNGQKALVEVLTGQRVRSSGSILVNGLSFSGRRHELARHKVYSLPEEPLRNACVAGLSVAHNMSLRNFDQPPLAHWGWINQRALRAQARHYVETFHVKTPGIDARIETLSGGNVQRAVLARELSHPVALLIVANPVFGLDFNAVAETHARLLAARDAGAAVLLVSEDLDELLELADRIVVMSEGQIVFETPAETANVRELGHYMAGGHEHEEVEEMP